MEAIQIYWGGALFNHKDLIGNAMLAEAVGEFSGGRYLPVLPQESEADMTRSLDIRDSDYDMLLRCDVMLANFDGSDLDSGTVAEFMAAKMLDYPAVLLRTDFRSPAESRHSPDPWNLMCSGFPRTRSKVIHAMELMNTARSETGRVWIPLYLRQIAAQIVAELDAVCAVPPLFRQEEQVSIYRNLVLALGGALPAYWTEEKIRRLIDKKAARKIY